jgi:DNA-binding NarL/FixJ family response regulator
MFFPKIPTTGGDRTAASVRVLIVDDYEPFRRFVCSTLERRTDLQVVGQAIDGLQAVQKAEELQPDLIVLDIGLPKLNGIEVARQIRKLSPQSKILILTQESSADMADEALSAGALGYVVKAHAARELLNAVDAVCHGRMFVSAGISERNCSSTADAKVPANPACDNNSPSPTPEKPEIIGSHQVQFYPDDEAFVVGFAYSVEAALQAGNAVIVAATESHCSSLLQRLREHGVNYAAAKEQGRFLSLDVSETLAAFMLNGQPDPARFFRVVGGLIKGAARSTAEKRSRVVVCGECASILWAQGNADAAIQVERFCNQLNKQFDADILCGFSLSSFYREEDMQVFQKICSEP